MTAPAPDFRARCEELIELLSKYHYRLEETYHPDSPDAKELEAGFRVLERAEAALATPPPEPPTVEEIDRCIEHWKELCNYPTTRDRFKWAYLLDRDDILNAVRAILDRWGQ